LVTPDDHIFKVGEGEAYLGNVGFTVPELPSGRESFSPDVSYYLGRFDDDPMKFIPGPPTFAVEVRSEGDYTRAGARALAAKRADYFAAGTLVVWDIDPEAELIHVYRSNERDTPSTYARGEVAEDEPAVPDWRINVDEVFGESK
jgi:Uma2 family endonuclease